MERDDEKKFLPCFLATGVGSLPHRDVPRACALIARTLPETPFWPQLPKHSILESMNVQVSPGLPFLRVEEKKGEVFFDSARDQARELEAAYQAYLTADENSYAIPAAYAGGLEGMVGYLKGNQGLPLRFFKGQIAGPITFGLSVQDPEGRSLIHNEVAFDAVMKGLLLRGRWIIQRMKEVCAEVMLFIDEPGLSGYGSAFFSVEASTVIARLNEMIEEFQAQGVRVGVHCCGNTDWSLLLQTPIDILNFDAYDYAGSLAIYAKDVKKFIERGGVIAWGIIPTSTEAILKESVPALKDRLEEAMAPFTRNGISFKKLVKQSLLTPACGLPTVTEDAAERAFQLLAELSGLMKNRL